MIAKIGTEQERKKALKECLRLLSAAFGRELGADAADAYWIVLGELAPERMRRAVDKAIREEKFCPSPATIRQHARSLSDNGNELLSVQKPYTPPTAEQWEEIKAMNARIRRRCLAMAEELKP